MNPEIEKRYQELQPLPEPGRELTWVDRVRTWEDFLQRGRETAALLRKIRITSPDYDRDIRGLAPELHDLLHEAFPITPEEQKDLDEWREDLGFI